MWTLRLGDAPAPRTRRQGAEEAAREEGNEEETRVPGQGQRVWCNVEAGGLCPSWVVRRAEDVRSVASFPPLLSPDQLQSINQEHQNHLHLIRAQLLAHSLPPLILFSLLSLPSLVMPPFLLSCMPLLPPHLGHF